MHTLKRQHGLGVKQVMAITMHEARNAMHFGDADSVRSIAACAAFAMGANMGGRRPRTLTAIRLGHIRLYVGKAVIDDCVVLIPHIQVEFHQEKSDDLMGVRSGHDKPHHRGYSEEFWSSVAFWVYRLLVIRGCFHVIDPIQVAQLGDTLPMCRLFLVL